VEYNLTMDTVVSDNLLSYHRSSTVSFNEESKGWVSFKSFHPQVGFSLNGKYITAVSKQVGSKSKNKKGIWEHHVDIKQTDDTQGNFGEIINRNIFYAPIEAIAGGATGNYHTDSSFTVLFNDGPDSIKNFRAVSYEGSQARSFGGGIDTAYTPNGTPITAHLGWHDSNYDVEYEHLVKKAGWWVDKVTTDTSFHGFVRNFKNKENMWYKHISGEKRNDDFSLVGETDEFSVQGLGKAVVPPVSPIEITPDNTTTIQIINENDNE
jgi:hypothetical protein